MVRRAEYCDSYASPPPQSMCATRTLRCEPTFARGHPAPPFGGVSPTLKDADIDALTADGAQDTTRWADAIGAVAEAIRHLESAQQKAALVGEPEAGSARARWNFLVRTAAD